MAASFSAWVCGLGCVAATSPSFTGSSQPPLKPAFCNAGGNAYDVCSGETRPLATDPCNGLDDDCDNKIDEFSADKPLCNAPEKCIGGRCIVPSCAVEGSGLTCRDNDKGEHEAFTHIVAEKAYSAKPMANK